MNIKPKYKRTQYLVATKFQLKYVGLILLLMFMTALLCSYVVYYTMMIGMGEKLANVYPQGRLISILNAVNIRILLSVIFISPLVAIIGVFLSHKIAGPIYRMESFLNNVATGDLTHTLILRKGDEMAGLAVCINNVVTSIKTTVAAEKERSDKISGGITKLRAAIEQKSIDRELVNNLADSVAEETLALKNDFEKFKI